jgi:hypothetical protein
MCSDITTAALAIFERGANVLPLRLVDGSDQSKKPATTYKRWTTRPQTADDVARMFYKHEGNIGALGGVHSQAIVDAGYMAYIDCDSPRSFDIVGALIKSAYGVTLTVKSPRGGHYWILTDEPIRTHPFEGGELRGRGAYVAAPPSIHPTGIEYKWLDVDAPILHVNELPGFTFEVAPVERLPRLAARILMNNPETIGKYASRSEVDFALMLSLVNAGCSFMRISALFQSSRHESHLDPTKRDYLKRLEAEYLRAREMPDTESVKEAREFAGQVRVWALNTYSITGNVRTRETDRRVLLAHVDVVQHCGRLEWHMSRRDVEKSTQINSAQTVVNAHKRLQAAQIILCSKEHEPSYAASWTFGSGICRQVDHSHTHPPVCVSGLLDNQVQAYLHHAAFEHRGLGRNVARTFCAIVKKALNEDEIAAVTGWRPETVERHLEILLRHGLAAARTGGTWQALPAYLDDTAYALGTTGIAHSRARRIERERKAHRRQLARPRAHSSAHEHFKLNPPTDTQL